MEFDPVEPSLIVPTGSPPVLDGRCEEAAWERAATLDLGQGAILMALHDAERVYVCVRPTSQGLGTLDLNLATANGEVINLHVSAQVGERVLGADGHWPEFEWRNNDGWYGVPVPLSGFANGRPEFARGTAREMALDKARFGPLPWRIRIDMREVGAERASGVVFPAGAAEMEPEGWLMMDAGRQEPSASDQPPSD